MLDFTQQAGDAPGGLTILRADARHSASKHHIFIDGGYARTEGYDLGTWFTAELRICYDLRGLYDVVQSVRRDGKAIIVRGGLDAAWHSVVASNPGYRMRRLLRPADGDPAHIVEAERQWAMIDLDDVPLPPGADLRVDPDRIVHEIIVNFLPSCFHGVTCFYQWSSSAGIKSGFAKLHIYFWLTTPVANAPLRRWVMQSAPFADFHLFNANQPHYVSDPRMTGADDPVPERLGWLNGERETVTLPPLDEIMPKGVRSSSGANGAGPRGFCTSSSIEDALAKLRNGNVHSALLDAGMQYAFRCQRGGGRDDGAFKTRLRDAVEASATAHGRSLCDVADHLDDGYFNRLIEGAFRLRDSRIERERQEQGEPAELPPIELPQGFGMTPDGLWFVDPDEEDARPVRVCQPFTVLGECASDFGEHWGIVMSWQEDAGHPHTWIIDRAMLHGEPHAIAAKLEDKGLRCSFAKQGQNLLRRVIGSLRHNVHLTAVERGGWHGDSYVLPNGEVIGGDNVLMRTEIAKHDLASAQAGTLAEWQQHLGRYAVGNSRLVLFASAAFAGPLLDIVHEPSGGLHLYGGSQKGKTTAGLVAASVWGKGAHGGKLQQWRSTPNALEAVAARSSDGLLVMDELSQSEAQDAGAACYMLANEQGKGRLDRSANCARPPHGG